MPDSLVLVTGGSGFIAGHCIVELLQKGFRVRTTVRHLSREVSVRDVLDRAGISRSDALEFVAADLTRAGRMTSSSSSTLPGRTGEAT
jgi:nucleoside-diphosphate-sugar epimerase